MQCKGKTKKGARCRREAGDAEYCVSHQSQRSSFDAEAKEAPQSDSKKASEPGTTGSDWRGQDWADLLLDAAGVAAVVALALFIGGLGRR